jgi:hypothetical protein
MHILKYKGNEALQNIPKLNEALLLELTCRPLRKNHH